MLTFWGIYLLSGIHNPREKADGNPTVPQALIRAKSVAT
jgi:hypothetical protein